MVSPESAVNGRSIRTAAIISYISSYSRIVLTHRNSANPQVVDLHRKNPRQIPVSNRMEQVSNNEHLFQIGTHAIQNCSAMASADPGFYGGALIADLSWIAP
jgi:hypothetical protein